MDIDINIESQVSQTITDGVTDKAPSENAVFDALALKIGGAVSIGQVAFGTATGVIGGDNRMTYDAAENIFTFKSKFNNEFTDTTSNNSRPVIGKNYYKVNPNSTINVLTDFHGIDLRIDTQGSLLNNLISIYPFESQIFHRTAATINRAVGMYSLVENTGNGNMINATGLQLWNRNRGVGNVAKSENILIKNFFNDGGGTITDQYGVYIEAFSGATNYNYGLYSLSKSFIDKLEIGISSISTSTAESLRVHNSGRSTAIQVTTVNGVGIAVNGTGTGFAGVNSTGSWVIGVNGSTTTSGGVGVRGIGAGSSGTQIGVLGQSLNATSTNIALQANASGATTNIALDITAGNIRFNDLVNGTKIGTATSQKLAFWNATPIVQPTTAVTEATFVSNTGNNLKEDSTFDGYTMKQVVRALRNMGILA
jgi:hypothetical protein